MDYKKLYTDLIRSFLTGKASRREVSWRMTDEVPIDVSYENNVELLDSCECALRHIDEPNYYSTEGELKYYLSCLKGDALFSATGLDHVIEISDENRLNS